MEKVKFIVGKLFLLGFEEEGEEFQTWVNKDELKENFLDLLKSDSSGMYVVACTEPINYYKRAFVKSIEEGRQLVEKLLK